MASFIEIANSDTELQAKLFDSAMRAQRFFEKQGYNVEAGNRANTYPLQSGMQEACCGDDRYAFYEGNKLNIMGRAGRVSLIGGLYLVMAEISGGQPSGVETAYKYARERGILLTNHGDEDHGGLGCGMFNSWVNGKLLTEYVPNFGPDVILKAARDNKIDYHLLTRKHSCNKLVLNFLPATAVKRTSDAVTHDYSVSNILGIDDNVVTGIVFVLSKGLNINTIQIIK